MRVHVTHRVLPLHDQGFGRLLGETVRNAEYFWDSARSVRDRLADEVTVCVPFEPDTNLVCLLVNPVGNDALAVMNRFGRRVFDSMRVDAGRPLQVKEFIGSQTSIAKESLAAGMENALLAEVGIDPATFQRIPHDPEREASAIFVLRHTLMSPWLRSPVVEHDGATRNYIDLYWEHLERVLRRVVAER